MKNKKYYYELDILRGLACLIVFFSHLPIYKLIGATNLLYPMGCSGVYVFFVISGFIISKSFENQLEKSDCRTFEEWGKTIAKNRNLIYLFWQRRFARLFPALFFLFCCLGIVMVHYGITQGNLSESIARYFRLIGNFLLLDNSMNKPYDAIDQFMYWKVGVIWSLDCEILFYLIFPFFIVFKKLMRYLPIALLAFFILKSIMYSFVEFKYMYYSLFANLDFFILGILISHYSEKINVNKSFLTLMVIVSLYTLIIAPHDEKLYRFYLNGLITSGILVYAASKNRNLLNIRFLSLGKILHFVGVRSYFIYLTHVLTKYILATSLAAYFGSAFLTHSTYLNEYIKSVEINDQLLNFVILIVVILLSDLFYRFVEKPFVRRWKTKLMEQALEAPSS